MATKPVSGRDIVNEVIGNEIAMLRADLDAATKAYEEARKFAADLARQRDGAEDVARAEVHRLREALDAAQKSRDGAHEEIGKLVGHLGRIRAAVRVPLEWTFDMRDSDTTATTANIIRAIEDLKADFGKLAAERDRLENVCDSLRQELAHHSKPKKKGGRS